MDRREFLAVPKVPRTVGAKPRPARPVLPPEDRMLRTNSGLNPYNGSWTEANVIHLLKRTMYGARISDIRHFASLTPAQAINELLNTPLQAPYPPQKNYTTPGPPTLGTDPDHSLATGDPWINNYTNDGGVNSQRRNSYKAWWLGLMAGQQRTIFEKMVVFWHNHFATEANDIGNGIALYKHQTTIRQYALGNFKAMVKAITLDPSMLRYLNGERNNKNSPDENYARELQELFTLGKGPDSKYSEEDVKQAARVLTGYRVDYNTITSNFDPTRHDTGSKPFSTFYGSKSIAGRTGADGAKELDDLLNMIFSVDEVSKYICRKLYRWFVYYQIDAAAEANIITPLAALFRQNNFEIKPVLATLLKSEHFFDPLNHGCMIKSPADHVIGGCREMLTVFPPLTNLVTAYQMWAWLGTNMTNQQQNLGDPPDVAGWKAYYQEPQFYQIWINSDTLPKRNQFTDQMNQTGYTRSNFTIRFEVIAFTQGLPDPADPNKLIADAVKYLLGLPLTQGTRDQIKQDILLSGQSSDHYWSGAWQAYLNNPTDNMALTTVRTRLRSLYQYLMNLPEYQLM